MRYLKLDTRKTILNLFLVISLLLFLGVLLITFSYNFNCNNTHLNLTEKISLQDKSNKSLDSLINLFASKNSNQPATFDLFTIKKEILDLKEKNVELQKKLDQVNETEWSNFLKKWGIIGAIVGFSGILLFFKTFVETKAREEIQKITDVNKDSFNRILDTEVINNTLRDNTKISFLNEKGTSLNTTLSKVFKLLKTKTHTTPIHIKDLNEFSISNALDSTLIIIDNCKGQKEDDRSWKDNFEFNFQLLEFSKKITENGIAIFYFSEDMLYPNRNKDILNPKNLDQISKSKYLEFITIEDNKVTFEYEAYYNQIKNLHLISFANSHAAIYTNIMNLLKSQHYLKD